MKKVMIAVLVVALLLMAVGIAGSIFGRSFNNTVAAPYADSDYFRGGMMYDRYVPSDSGQDEVLDIEALEERVEAYIAGYGENLVISDIFVFEDSEYYFSIMEEDTGIGAMELLVDQYTGDVFPEYGPNMMWNLKYGMHNNSGYGMMDRGRGMMGRGYRTPYYSYDDDFDGNTISKAEAREEAQQYLDQYQGEGYLASDDAHEFYGYYTFHIQKNGEPSGMLSVNGLTGDVWYHDWHGVLKEVIEGHDDGH
jgi:hypothetical protein